MSRQWITTKWVEWIPVCVKKQFRMIIRRNETTSKSFTLNMFLSLLVWVCVSVDVFFSFFVLITLIISDRSLSGLCRLLAAYSKLIVCMCMSWVLFVTKVCVCVCVFFFVLKHSMVCVCMSVCICVCVCVCVCVFVYVYVCLHVWVFVCLCVVCTGVCVFVFLFDFTLIIVCVRLYVRVCMRVCVCGLARTLTTTTCVRCEWSSDSPSRVIYIHTHIKKKRTHTVHTCIHIHTYTHIHTYVCWLFDYLCQFGLRHKHTFCVVAVSKKTKHNKSKQSKAKPQHSFRSGSEGLINFGHTFRVVAVTKWRHKTSRSTTP